MSLVGLFESRRYTGVVDAGALSAGISSMFRRVCRRILRYILDDKPSDPLEYADWFRRQGVVIGNNTYIYPGVTLGRGNAGYDPIEIGCDCVLTGCTVLAHDASTNRSLGLTKSYQRSVKIGDRCFVGWGAIILMGVELGDDCIVGAGAVVTKSFPAGSVIGGNPAKLLCTTDSLVERRRVELLGRSDHFRSQGISGT